MPTLNISEFSCMKEASISISPVTVLIGPQGSGKSVTTKLHYFCSDIISNAISAAERGDSLEEFKRNLARQFTRWFPPSAWGKARFNINYSSGPFSVRFLRRLKKHRPGDELTINFSDWFDDQYRKALLGFRRTLRIEGDGSETPFPDSFQDVWRARELVSTQFARSMKEEYIRQQVFIPAGRAFFTSIGRLVAGLEQAGSLDPVTIKFARLFASIRDVNGPGLNARLRRIGEEYVEERRQFMKDLFGGEVRFGDETEFVQATDGRKIPFTSLSSGQQELLPMWSLIDWLNQSSLSRLKINRPDQTVIGNELVYIEEPEAHLFPSAQGQLMEFLIRSLSSSKDRRHLILTTHSPYIMGKLNVFLKAGNLARRRRRTAEIGEIVPRDCWITDRQLSAFAIEGGKLRNLIDDDGLIDSTYLDGISEELSREFSALLQLESEF